ncbi:hypothetical protein PRZ48_012387 [Zasmidium cellare]|uniref:F-box domain-containing protein n=1 Tax=Zasmidium cellare TaxID=395010 RepID=A0ABR0E4Q1_ZASCE|nr:hypothetical protein PRZ48_012387 [Zasmidium cellare]
MSEQHSQYTICLTSHRLAMNSQETTSYSIMDMEENELHNETSASEDCVFESTPASQIVRSSDVSFDNAPATSKTTSSPEKLIEPSAAQRVFSTVELLEMILLQLPVTTLFAFQRVNTKFHDTITDSIHLRRAMFLEADPSFEASNRQQINPILDQCTFVPQPGLYLELITNTTIPIYRSLTESVDFDIPYFTTKTGRRTRLRDKVWLGHVREATKPLKLPRHTDVRESWQYMLLKQGRKARTSVRLWCRFGQNAKPLDYARLRFKKKTYMGKVWDFIEEMH